MVGWLTCDCALAGIPSGDSPDTVWGKGYFITTILDEDCVPACHIWHISHRVCAIMIILDVCLLGLAFRVLCVKAQGRRLVQAQQDLDYLRPFIETPRTGIIGI